MENSRWTAPFQAFFVAAMLSAAVMELLHVDVAVTLFGSFGLGLIAAAAVRLAAPKP